MIWSVVADAERDPRAVRRLGLGLLAGVDRVGDRVGAEVDAEFGLESGDDRAGGGEDPVGGVLDEFDVGAGPVGDVRDRVLAGVDAEDVAHDVGDGFGFDFDPVAGRHAFLLGVGVHEDVAEFVDLGLERLCRGEVVAHGDGLLEEVGDALRSVGSVERSTLEGEAGGVDLLGDRLPQLGRRVLAGEQLGLRGQVGRRDELTLVEDRDELEADDGCGSQFAGVLVELAPLGADRGVDAQRGLALADPAGLAVGGGDLLPGVERRDESFGALGGEEQLVVRRVAVERPGDAQQVLPVLARGDLGDGVGERGVGGGEAFFVGGACVHDVDGEPVTSPITSRPTAGRDVSSRRMSAASSRRPGSVQ